MKPHRLASNENPFGAGAPAQNALRAVPLGIYPDASMIELRTRLATHHGLGPAEVCVGAGATDLIFQLVAALASGGEVLAPRHTFVAYRLAAQTAGARYRETGTGLRTDLGALAAALSSSTRLICIVNPANPTGAFLQPDALEDFLRQVPREVPVVLDEAYAEYVAAPNDCFGPALSRRFGNVITVRTFSKAYGLAGLRVGYALGNASWFARVDARRPPFSVGSHAQAAAVAALEDQPHMRASVAATQAERERLWAAVSALGFEVPRSDANFLCIRVGDPVAASHWLRDQGVEVMPLQSYGLDEWLRVTIGLPHQNDLFLDALRGFRRVAPVARVRDRSIASAPARRSLTNDKMRRENDPRQPPTGCLENTYIVAPA